MRKFLLPFSVAAALVVGAASIDLVAQRQGPPPRDEGAAADAPQGPRRGGPGRMGPQRPDGPAGPGGFGRQLNLTEEQRAKVDAIVRDSRDKIGPVQDELRLAQSTLRREVFADQRNTGRITEFANKVAQLEKQLADARLQTSLAIADVLTPEQRQRMRSGAGAGAGLGRGPMRGPGPGAGPGFGRGMGR